METNRQLKLIVLGDAQVGKTALLSKYVLDMFRPQYTPTLGVDLLIKEILLGDWVLKCKGNIKSLDC